MSYARLVAPTVSFLAVLVLLVGARTYDSWPLKPPACSLRTLTGVPCVGCGGTRAMKALVHGDYVAAVSFNPLAMLGVFAVLVWFVWTAATMKSARYKRGGTDPTVGRVSSNTGKWWGIAIAVLVLLNWIYLICYLPR